MSTDSIPSRVRHMSINRKKNAIVFSNMRHQFSNQLKTHVSIRVFRCTGQVCF